MFFLQIYFCLGQLFEVAFKVDTFRSLRSSASFEGSSASTKLSFHSLDAPSQKLLSPNPHSLFLPSLASDLFLELLDFLHISLLFVLFILELFLEILNLVLDVSFPYLQLDTEGLAPDDFLLVADLLLQAGLSVARYRRLEANLKFGLVFDQEVVVLLDCR